MKKTLLYLICALLAGFATFGSVVAFKTYDYNGSFTIGENENYYLSQAYRNYLAQEEYNIMRAQFDHRFDSERNEYIQYDFSPSDYHSPFYYEIVDTNTNKVIHYNDTNFKRTFSSDELVDTVTYDFANDTKNDIKEPYLAEYDSDHLRITIGRTITESDFTYQLKTFDSYRNYHQYSWLAWLWIGVVFFGILLLVYHYQTAKPNWISKLPTEIVLILSLVIFFVFFVGAVSPGAFFSSYVFNDSTPLELPQLIFSSVYVVGLLSIMTFGIMMLLTKIKHGDLFKNSLIGRGVTGSVSLFGLLKNQTKLFIAMISLGLLNLFVLLTSRSSLLGLILLLIDGVVIYFVLKIVSQNDLLFDHLKNIREGDFDKQLDKTTFSPIFEDKIDDINHLHEGINKAVEKSLKEERMSIDLITNVSHDLKTPLTSILNYTQMMIDNENPDKHPEYLQIIKEKALRLSALSNDVVEASKASSGKVDIDLREINALELLNQVLVEHQSGFESKGLSLLINEESINYSVMADSQRLYRVYENLFRNIEKYALENTRVYIEGFEKEQELVISFKNVSANQLGSKDLTARFVQGDEARSEEGNGLGLAIAKDLMKLQEGSLWLELDGDLFKVYISLPKIIKGA